MKLAGRDRNKGAVLFCCFCVRVSKCVCVFVCVSEYVCGGVAEGWGVVIDQCRVY